MIYRAVSVELICDSKVPDSIAREIAASMAHVVRAAAYSWLAVQKRIPGVDFLVDGDRVQEPTVLDLQVLAHRDPETGRHFAELIGRR